MQHHHFTVSKTNHITAAGGSSASQSNKQVEGWDMPWEDQYGYAQAVKVGDTVYVSGQLSHDDAGKACRCEHCGREWLAIERSTRRLLADVVNPPTCKAPAS